MKKTLIALMALAGVAMGDTYWSFEGTLNSEGDNAYTGTATSGVTVVNTTTTTGDVLGDGSSVNLGYALDFTDGHYVRYNNADLGTQLLYGSTATTSYTLMGYVNFANVTGERYFFGTGATSGTRGVAFGIDGGTVDLLGKGNAHFAWTGTTLTAGEWYHLAFAYSSGENTMTLFVNGVDKGSVNLSSSMSNGNIGSSAPTNDLYIGSASNSQDDFVGQVAHLQIITGEALGVDAVKQYASSIIPEPATATLSLLALAGLAARRRRK